MSGNSCLPASCRWFPGDAPEWNTPTTKPTLMLWRRSMRSSINQVFALISFSPQVQDSPILPHVWLWPPSLLLRLHHHRRDSGSYWRLCETNWHARPDALLYGEFPRSAHLCLLRGQTLCLAPRIPGCWMMSVSTRVSGSSVGKQSGSSPSYPPMETSGCCPTTSALRS